MGQAARAEITGFQGSRQSLFTYTDRSTALLGVALLVMPVAVLAAAAGRLGAARREARLAALRRASPSRPTRGAPGSSGSRCSWRSCCTSTSSPRAAA
jgi:hypothetical protein